MIKLLGAVLIVLIALMPLSASAQYSWLVPANPAAVGYDYSGGSSTESKLSGYAESRAVADQDVMPQGCSGQYPYLCGGECWKCNNPSDVFTCYNNAVKCCPSQYPYYCGRTGSCWKDSNQCNNAIQCNGQWLACTTTNYIPTCVDNQVFCCDPSAPYYWGGGCHKCSSDAPNECGGSCWSNCNNVNYPHWNCKANGETTCCASGFPVYCERTGNCWKDSDECSRAQTCGSEGWTVCRDTNYPYWQCKSNGQSVCCPEDSPYLVNDECSVCPADKPNQCGNTCYDNDDCDGYQAFCKDGQVRCCSADYPQYCERTSGCWLNRERCDTAILCDNAWWACNDAGYNEKCVDNKHGCCLPEYPYFCPGTDTCFRQDGLCDGRPVYDCSGKRWVCIDKNFNGTCVGNELRCCPSDYPYWWESDKQCHASPYQQKICNVPDGSSAECDCNANSDCPSSHPYCQELYPSPISDGYDACVAAEPEYCGNGRCAAGEDYNTCSQDCSGYAPKGAVNVDVSYSSGDNADEPVFGAYVYLDNTLKGTTDSNGKSFFEAGYGQRSVKVLCPDNSFCSSRIINIDGTEYVNFGCNCNPPGDFDDDGYSDEDEVLLGTDPQDENSNFATTFSSDSVNIIACLPTPASLLIIWKEYRENDGNLIQANSLVIGALNITSVTGVSVGEKPYVVADAVYRANFPAEVVIKTNMTLENAVRNAEYVDGIFTQNELILVATDKDTRTTTIITIGAGCVGAFSGTIYGIGQGAVDDVKGIVEGIWFVITHITEIQKIWSAVTELVSGVINLLKNPGALIESLFKDILGKGRGINVFRSDRIDNREAYRQFQVGFVYGFVTGYLVEQVALMSVAVSKVTTLFKTGKLLGSAGKAMNLVKKLLLVRETEGLGAEVAEKLSKLKYLKEGIDAWSDSDVKGLARMMKHNEGWLKGLSEVEAKLAAKKIDNIVVARNVPDNSIKQLLDTNIGRKTLLAADGSEALLAKQARLAELWGPKTLDDVANRFDGFWWWQKDGWKKVNKLLKEIPEEALGDKVKAGALQGALLANNVDKLVDALKDLKQANGAPVLGVDKVVKQMLENPSVSAYSGFSDQLIKASEMKQAGKIIDELEVSLKSPTTGLELTRADIKYEYNGFTRYMEHKNWNWATKRQEDVDELIKQLRNYNTALGDWDKIRLSSRNPIPPDVVNKLRVEFGNDAVNKILGGE